MASNDFFAKTEALAKKIGDGTLSGVFAVDGGPRSVPLEVGGWKSGPNAGVQIRDWTTEGTGPHAAQNSLEQTYQASYEDIAKTALTQGTRAGMERAVERINDRFKEIAPKDTGQYRESTARFVIDDTAPVYERYGSSYGDDPDAA
jgi:hypothetical protein